RGETVQGEDGSSAASSAYLPDRLLRLLAGGLHADLGGVEVVVGLDFELALGSLGKQISANERINVAVEHAVDIANAKLGAMVLNQAIGLHDVGANLAAKGNFQLGFVQLVGGIAALLHFHVVEFGAQHLHRKFAVFVLAAFRLARHDNAGGDVGEAHGRLHFIDVLPAFTTRAKRLQLDVFRLDVHLDAVINFGNNENGSERRVTPRRLIKLRNPYQAVYSGLTGQQAICIFAAEFNGGILDARFFARRFIQNVGGDSLSFRPP